MTFDLLDPLDDPEPYLPDAGLVPAVVTRGRQIRRRRRGGLAAGAVPVVLVLALVAGAVYVDHRTNDVARVDIAAGVLATPAADAPSNILVVGIDSPGVDGHLQVDGGAGPMSDSQMIVHVDPASHRVAVLGLPRDLVFAGATSGADRLNNQARTGPEALIRSIHDHLGIEIAHYVQIDFHGFERLIDAVGGVSVQSTVPVRDLLTGMSLDPVCRRLDGTEALGLARSRHLEYDTGYPGRPNWQTDPAGDLGRIQRQQLMLGMVLHQLRAMPTDPVTVEHLLTVFADNTTLDAGFSRSAILDLVRWGRSLEGDAITSETLPVESATLADGADVLRPTGDAPAAIAAFDRGEAWSSSSLPAIPGPRYAITGCDH